MLLGVSFFERVLFPIVASYHLQVYYGLVLYVLFALVLCSILVTVAYLLSLSASQDSEKRSEYECGFEPFDSATRLPFDVHFYLVGILFLIFDVEIALLFPWVLGLGAIGWFGFYLMLGFILILGIGFLYEWKRGALIWPAKQSERPYVANTSSKLQVTAFCLPVLVATSPASDNFILCSSFYTELDSALLPEALFSTVIVGLLAVLAVELGDGRSKKQLAHESLNALGRALQFTIALYVIQLIFGGATTLLSGYLATNVYIVSLKVLTAISGYFILVNSRKYIQEHRRHVLEYPLVLALAILFMLLLVGSNHLISAFLALVGFSLNLYVLILFDAPTATAREAGIKYFYLSTFSSGLMIYGIFLLFIVLGTGDFREINQLISTSPTLLSLGEGLLNIGIVFILVGLFFKLSAFPGHLWAADVYEGSPDPITAFFMLPVKVAVLGFVLQFLTTALESASAVWQPIISFSAALSLLWGCFAALTETKTKRFLAYASINQIGFLLLGIASGSFEGYRATLLYLLIYAVMNIGFLVIFLSARRADGKSLVYLTDFRGLGQENWLVSWSAAMILLSMAGIPPLAGFFGKYYLLLHAQEQGLYGLVIIALVTSLVSTYYYLRIIKIFWFEGTTAMTSVRAGLTKQQSATLYAVESFLWAFAIVSSQTFAYLNTLTAALMLPGVASYSM